MLEKIFPKLKPKTPEIRREEPDLITVMASHELSDAELLDAIKDGQNLRFILTRHNIYLSRAPNEDIMQKLFIKKKDCLIPNGAIRYDSFSKTLKFGYSLEENLRINEVRRNAQQKITKFLKRNGIEVEKIEYMN